uniref:Chemokine (C-X-C motif) ligand 11, duplicate 8 n=1 Tax=Sinocyclocheilus rhinocerous TaxID=307959 RepID=A0A673FQH5_9TELE
MKTATFIVLVCLLVVEVKGHSLDVKGRCICADKGVNKVSRKAIEKVEIILPSPSCKRLEIVVTMRGAGQKCLNPGSRFTKKYILTSLLLSLPKKVLFILSSLSRNTQKAAV